MPDNTDFRGDSTIAPSRQPGDAPLTLSIQDISTEVSVVYLAGELDAFSCGALRVQLSQFVNRGGRHLVLNLVELRHIDSAGLGSIIEAIHQIRRQNGSLSVVSPPGRVREAFAVTQLDRILDIYPTEHHALRFFLSA